MFPRRFCGGLVAVGDECHGRQSHRSRRIEHTKKQAAAAWLRADAERIAQALDESVWSLRLQQNLAAAEALVGRIIGPARIGRNKRCKPSSRRQESREFVNPLIVIKRQPRA